MDGSTVPLLGPEITHKDVPSVLAERHIPKLFDKGDLIQVVEQISKECEVGQKSQIYSNKAIDRFLASLEELAKKKILPLTT